MLADNCNYRDLRWDYMRLTCRRHQGCRLVTTAPAGLGVNSWKVQDKITAVRSSWRTRANTPRNPIPSRQHRHWKTSLLSAPTNNKLRTMHSSKQLWKPEWPGEWQLPNMSIWLHMVLQNFEIHFLSNLKNKYTPGIYVLQDDGSVSTWIISISKLAVYPINKESITCNWLQRMHSMEMHVIFTSPFRITWGEGGMYM